MKYMFLIYGDESTFPSWTEERSRKNMEGHMALAGELGANGRLHGGDPLQGSATATTVRVRDGANLVSDGPFAETKEQLLGYYIVDCDDLDEAIAVAARIPDATHGTVEIRPVMAIPAMTPQA